VQCLSHQMCDCMTCKGHVVINDMKMQWCLKVRFSKAKAKVRAWMTRVSVPRILALSPRPVNTGWSSKSKIKMVLPTSACDMSPDFISGQVKHYSAVQLGLCIVKLSLLGAWVSGCVAGWLIGLLSDAFFRDEISQYNRSRVETLHVGTEWCPLVQLPIVQCM